MKNAQAGVKSINVEAVIIRADGTVENLGVIASWKKPSLLSRVKDWFKAGYTRFKELTLSRRT
jgi:hypothetical protein